MQFRRNDHLVGLGHDRFEGPVRHPSGYIWCTGLSLGMKIQARDTDVRGSKTQETSGNLEIDAIFVSSKNLRTPIFKE